MQQVIKTDNSEKYTVYSEGTVFILSNYYDGISEREAFILAKCYEEDSIFQIIQITGLHSEYLLGYVKYGILRDSLDAVTYDELIESIKFNFIGPDLDTLIIMDNPLELVNLNLINSTHQQV